MGFAAPTGGPGGGEMDRWWIGCAAAVVGSLGAGLGENLVRLSFARLPEHEEDHPPVYKRPLWVCGWLLTTILASVCAVVGLMYAPLQLVMPIGGLHILFGVYVAHLMGGEGLGREDVAGAVAVLVGVMVVLLGVEKHSPKITFDTLRDVLLRPSSVLFFGTTWMLVGALAACQRISRDPAASKYVRSVVNSVRPVTAPALSGLMSANANLLLKFALSLSGEGGGWAAAQSHFPFYVLCALTAACGVAQVVTLNYALEVSSAVLVVPTSNSVLITVGSIGGLVYAPNVTYANSFALLFGVVLVIAGIVLLAMREQGHIPRPPPAVDIEFQAGALAEPNPSFTSAISTGTRGSFAGYCENISFNQMDHVHEIKRTLSRFGRTTRAAVELGDENLVRSVYEDTITPPAEALPGHGGWRPRQCSRVTSLYRRDSVHSGSAGH